MQPVRWGVIGNGVIGKGHVKTLLELPGHAELVAVADLLDEPRAAAQAAGVRRIYRTDEQLLDDPDVQAVAVALPTGMRDSVVIKALRRGKHVLFEKPPAMNAATIQQFMALRGGLTVACGSGRITLSESARAIRRVIADGRLGELRLVRILVNKAAGKPPHNPPPPWRQSFSLNGGGILVNWGVYDLQYMLDLCNWQLRPTSVLAHWWPVGQVLADRVADSADADSHFVALARCAGGEVISFERGEFMPTQTQELWQILGVEGTLTMSLLGGKHKTVRLDQADPQEGVVTQTLPTMNETINGMAAQYIDFTESIHQRRPPAGNLEQCLIIQRIFDAVYASARCGQSVSIMPGAGSPSEERGPCDH